MYGKIKPKQIEYNGIEFSSMLELKFALLIEDSCEYMIEPVTIWYNRTNLDLRMKSECPHKYVPDFLVRKLKDNTAHLIEIKPHAFLDDEMVKLKKTLAERYIKEHELDWKFKIITDRQINLSVEKQKKLREIKEIRKFLKSKKRLLKLERSFTDDFGVRKNKIPFKTNLDLEERDYLIFLKTGMIRENE